MKGTGWISTVQQMQSNKINEEPFKLSNNKSISSKENLESTVLTRPKNIIKLRFTKK